MKFSQNFPGVIVNNFSFLLFLYGPFWMAEGHKVVLSVHFIDQQYLTIIKSDLMKFSQNLPVVMENNFDILQFFIWVLFASQRPQTFLNGHFDPQGVS